MKGFCFATCVVLLFSTWASSQTDSSGSNARHVVAPYRSATLLKLTALARPETHELQRTSLLGSQLVSETVVTYEFAIRSGGVRYISRYTPEDRKQPGNLPHAWWQGGTPVVIRVSNRSLLIHLPGDGEVSSQIVSQTTAK